MAYAELLNDPQKSLDLLANTPTIQSSSVGLFLRGIARVLMADHSQDADMLERANRDLEYVQLLFRDNQCALAYRVLALANAINLARAEGRPEDITAYEAIGREVAEKLEQ